MEELSRKQKKSHDHRFTTWLKNIIFGIVMIAPFLSVMARTIYVQSNPNAMQSYYGDTINESKVVTANSYTDFIVNNDYHYFSGNEETVSISNNSSYRFFVDNVTNFTTTSQSFNIEDVDLISSFYFSYYTVNYIVFMDNEENQLNALNLSNYTVSFDFTLEGLSYQKSTFNNYYLPYINYKIYTPYSFLDNAFEYSINQLHNVEVYNWSKNTAIYTAIDNMTNGLGMGANNTLALLLAYWSILTAVYIVFDIIIFCFTKITHFINSD